MSATPFELISSTAVPSLRLELRQYRHPASGARHFHFACDDPNNAFMVALPTLPQDSTGVAHILEHTTLCGSRRYPVRDPFFMMTRRSLNTFMNAFTSSDSTAYPFATQNRKDFDNLLKVYLDAVFFPRLDPLDFAQEGWRLEVVDAPAPAQPPLEFHGVVYNEMKGAMSAPIAQLWQHLHAALFPDTIYRHNSGGDPLAIPDLSYAALQAFHARHYRPANAVFMTYGSFPEANHQAYIRELVLEQCTAAPELMLSPLQAPFHAPRELEAVFHVDEAEERSTHIVWAWVLGESADVEAVVHAHLLSAILLEHSASPLRHYLETTELANAPSELCGIDDSARQLVFICGVEGGESVYAAALESAIFEVLEQVANTGIDADALTAIVDRIEMAQRDIGGGGYPFGLQLMGRVLPAAMYRRNPATLLDLDPVLARLRRDIADPAFVKALVRRKLLGNPHRARVAMVPDPAKSARDEAHEHARLATLAQSMTADDFARLEAEAAALRARQASIDDPDILPRVTLADVPPVSASPVAARQSRPALEVFEYACGTNGIFRVQAVFDLPALSAEELRVLPLMCEYLTEFGHEREDYLAVQARRALTGTFSTNTLARTAVEGGDMRACLVIGGKALARKRDASIDITAEILRGVRFDEPERLRELLMQSRAEAEQSITDRGHHLAVITAARELTRGAALDDLWDGPSAHLLLKDLAHPSMDDDALEHLFACFAAIRTKLLAAPRRVVLIGEAEVLRGAASRCDAMAGTGEAPTVPFEPHIALAAAPNGWTTHAQVNFCAKAYPAVHEGAADAAALAVLGRYLQDGFLHGEIREKGGAYGSGAGYDGDSATFRFFSYRDPRGLATLADFDRALDWFAGDRDAQRLEESILGTVRALDQPRSPAGEAERAFFNLLFGRDDAFRTRVRERVLSATHASLATVAERYLQAGTGRVGVVCGAAAQAEFERAGISFGKL